MTCPACFIVDGCGGIGHDAIENHCCRCIPNRVCVSLSTDTDVCGSEKWADETSIISSVEAQWISPVDGTCPRKYTGTLECGDLDIDFVIEFYRDPYTEICYLALESMALGYTYDPQGDDLRVLLPLGGDYNDAAVKRAECRAMSFDFPIDISYGAGTIRVRPAPYVAAIKRRPGLHCMFKRVCIIVFDGYSETAYHLCSNAEYEGTSWTFLHDDDAGQPVTIMVDAHNPTGDGTTTLSLVSWLNPTGDPIVVDAECPDMVAQWDLPDGAWIRIRGDKLNKCTDCKCYCECICVLYVEDELTQARGMACRQISYDGCSEYWTITLLEKVFTFYLQCLDCENPATYLTIEPPGDLALISTESQSVLCPDQISAEWTMSRDYGAGTGHITVSCAACGEECTLDELSVGVPCCPDVRVPTLLYATVTGSSGCPQFPIGTVIGLGKTGPAEGACWTGSATVIVSGNPCVQHFSLGCFGAGESAHWYMIPNDCSTLSESGTEVTIVSCDPLILEVTLVVGCCDGSPSATVTLQVTA